MSNTVRQRILDTASALFYRDGVHAVGVDTIIAQSGVAKSSLYRHFRSKDDLIAAYIQSENDAFWERWDEVASPYADDPYRELITVLDWIGTKIATPGYRGCPHLNVSAEFPDAEHPARRIATNHKTELRRRLADLAKRLKAPVPELVADQLWLFIDGAFANHDLIVDRDPSALLKAAADSILARPHIPPSDAASIERST